MVADDAFELAIEQFLWWRNAGLEPGEMLRAVGVRLPYWVLLDTETVVRILADAERERAFSAKHAHKLRAA